MYTLGAVGNFSIPKDFFSNKNINFLVNKIRERVNEPGLLIDIPSMQRVMTRVLDERPDDIAWMNSRVVMIMTNHYWTEMAERKRNLDWQENFVSQSQLIDHSGRKSHIPLETKYMNSDFRGQKNGGTLRFYFT